ncbi:zinc finger BED domain-containing protein RICESLEEPER 2-like [Juglans microcarpa x Juglans regia]|uniref:zinc finger BED domain-containing protein RICESLEEPER 2-like n=1 Tax=Juglans microcarpa x Juglans regia TaxID=2249226 RepID=UPI001B7DEB3E|nr:zinc finger BED domain-containing protein RICESLEEPER 2-like [Juglans microcarpa x Juglans regia]
MCLLEWGRPKMFTITLDNASSNNVVVSYLKRKTKNRSDTILEHEFLHMRCYAHILNLIVRDGLKEYDQSIARIRGAVKYVKSSPQRLNTFKQCCDNDGITCKSGVCLDVATRWNSTYMMLDRAEKFQKAFERLEDEDPGYIKSVGEDDSDDDDGVSELDRGGASKLGPPTMDDWDKSRLFANFLKLFYDATCVSRRPIMSLAIVFLFELATIQAAINMECVEGPHNLRTMAFSMKSKYEKYWGNIEKMNLLLYVGLVFDPRYKLRGLTYIFEGIYEDNSSKVFMLVDWVQDALTRLYDSYCENDESNVGIQDQTISQSSERGAGSTSSTVGVGQGDFKSLIHAQIKKCLESDNSLATKSELERYLSEKCEEDDVKFDLLTWWKVNSIRYCVLSRVARDVLAVPISTVASESAFSTAGRVLDPFRSSLSPLMVEALICTQNWLRSSAPINIRTLIDDVEEFEKIDTELMEDLENSSRPTSLAGDN